MGKDFDLVRERSFNPLIAGVLSFIVPGLGQLYKGQFWGALLWFLLTGAGYALFVIPGVVLHFFCVLAAAFNSAGKERLRFPS
jgi:TM2 domain-containing membrane protein YozV